MAKHTIHPKLHVLLECTDCVYVMFIRNPLELLKRPAKTKAFVDVIAQRPNRGESMQERGTKINLESRSESDVETS